MRRVLERARAEHIDAVAFGDLFLEDVRRYRETRMTDSGLRLLFPLWQRPTPALAREMIAGGLRAVLTIRAVRTASFTVSCSPARCFATRFRSSSATSSNATGSCLRTCCRLLARRHPAVSVG
jgi:diphthamide synthase (EF-2-diphthine--ammonia ligase)